MLPDSGRLDSAIANQAAARAPGTHLPRLIALAGYGLCAGLAVGLLILVIIEAGSFTVWAARADFGLAYIGAHLALDGPPDRLYDIALQRQMHAALVGRYTPVYATPFNYPAWDALLFAPLGWLSYPAAFLVWTLISLSAGSVALGRLTGAVATTRQERVLLLLAAIGWLPTVLVIAQGQFGFIPLLGLVGTLLAWRAGRERAAGAWLLLGLIKPQLIAVPLLALLVGRRWRALAVFVAGAAIIFGASLLAFGNWVPAYIAFLLDFARPGANIGDFPATMQNWRGLIYHLLGTDTGPVGGSLVAALTLLSVGAVVVICGRWGAFPNPPAPLPGPGRGVTGGRRESHAATHTEQGGRKGPGWEVRFAVAVVLGLLVDPHVYMYDTVIALLPGLVLWGAAQAADSAGSEARMRLGVLRVVLAGGPFVSVLALAWSGPGVQILPAYLVLLLLAAAWAWRDLRLRRTTDHGRPTIPTT